MHNLTMTNISNNITNKGKNSPSYQKVNGVITPVWITLNGGIEDVKSMIEDYITKGFDNHQIRTVLNISINTINSFIKNNMENIYYIKEGKNRLLNNRKRRSEAKKGQPNPLKGKTYKEIYGDVIPSCGFKHGKDNPNFTRDKFIGCTLLNKSGRKFRSSYEVKFSEILESNNIKYDYEHHYKLINNTIKIVDFIINDILIEVTGYAYLKWQQDFDAKIALLNKTYPNHKIIIISDCNKLEMLKHKHGSYCNIVSLNDEQGIINLINNLNQ
jgi:hypothetical protein